MNWRVACYAQRHKTLAERFWEKVDKSGDCWIWKGCRDKDGYGFFRDGGKNLKAHRISLVMSLGRPLVGDALHSCDNPSCVNPDHLREGTNAMNQADSAQRGRKGCQKLCVQDVQRIREAYFFGSAAQDLADAYGVTRGTIYHIAYRKKWAHVA